MSARRTFVVLVVLALLAPSVSPPLLAQCAMCQTALLNSSEGRGIGAEFNHAILVMLFAPYAVLGSIGLVLLRHRIGAALRRSLGRPRVPRSVRPALRAD